MKIGDLWVQVKALMKGFDSDVTTQATKTGEKAGKNLSKSMSKGLAGAKGGILQGLGLGAGLGAFQLASQGIGMVTDALFKSIEAASALGESTSKAGVVFGESSAEMVEWSEKAAVAIGLSKQAALEASGTLGNLLLSMGKTSAEAATMSRTMVDLAADLASFNNVDIQEVLMAMRSGLTGEIAPLRRFGVNLTEAALKAKGLELGLFKGKGVMDAAAKSASAYALILEQTGTAQGDFERTSGGLANQQRILGAQMEDLSAKVGEKLLPFMVELAKTLNDDVIPALEDLIPLVEDLFADLSKTDAQSDAVGFFQDLGDAIIDTVDKATFWDKFESQADGRRRRRLAEAAQYTRDNSREVVTALDGVGDGFTDMGEDADKGTAKVVTSFQDMVDDLNEDAQDLIDGFFNPIHTEEQRHDARLAVFAAQEAVRKAKTKKDAKEAARAVIKALEDEASALQELGTQGKLTSKDVDKFEKDVKSSYAALGKRVPIELQKIIDKMRVVATFDADISVTVKSGKPAKAPAGKKAATGAHSKAGEIWQVNERGMEFFRPDVSGQIIPLDPNTKGPATGSTRTSNLTINYPDPRNGPEDYARTMRRLESLGL